MLWLNRKGFTLVEIMIVVAIIGLLAVIAIPNFVKARQTARKNLCINNLRLIDSAKEQWAIEYGKTSADTPTSADLEDYFRGNVFPRCPSVAAGVDSYTINAIGTSPTCSESVNLEHALPARL